MLINDDILALKRGWKVGFGDDDDFIVYFFANYDCDTTRHIMRNDRGEIVAQMHYFIFDDTECGEKGCYIYGVTTLPEWRGKRLAQTMINEVLDRLRELGIAYAVLIAQEDGLRKWYEKLGFRLMTHSIEVLGAKDNMNFAMDDTSLNKGMYYTLKEGIQNFSTKLKIENGKWEN